MTVSKLESTSHSREPSTKAPYRSPKLEVLGSLRSATRGVGSKNGDAGQNMMVPQGSDRRVKEDIVKIGQHPLGLGIYRYRYKVPYGQIYGSGRQIGVMADEVAERFPHAVSLHPDGYLMVDYGKLFH